MAGAPAGGPLAMAAAADAAAAAVTPLWDNTSSPSLGMNAGRDLNLIHSRLQPSSGHPSSNLGQRLA